MITENIFKDGEANGIRFVIPGRLDGLNEYIGACRSNAFAGANMKKKNEKIVQSAVFAAGLEDYTFDKPVKVSIVWVEKNRRRDIDNVSSFGKKVILDAIVKLGILEDDGWKYISGFQDTFDVDKENPHIEVTIVEDANI